MSETIEQEVERRWEEWDGLDSFYLQMKIVGLERELVAARNRIAEDAGIPIQYCPNCSLPLNSDHTHRTYEEHDMCRNTRNQQ